MLKPVEAAVLTLIVIVIATAGAWLSRGRARRVGEEALAVGPEERQATKARQWAAAP
jgi:hypothetical protein